MYSLLRRINKLKPRILLYHRIFIKKDKFFPPQGMGVSLDNFYSHIKWLKDNYHLISLKDMLKGWQRREILPYTIAITFDDGYQDNFTFGYSLLSEFKVKATLFVTADIFKKRFLWYDLFFYALNMLGKERLLGFLEETFKTTFDSFQEAYTYIKYNLESASDFLEMILDKFKLDLRKKKLYLDTEALKKMEDVFDYGCHGLSHLNLRNLPLERLREEICTSKRELEKILGREVIYFSFPFGRKNDLQEEAFTLLRQASYEYAFSAESGYLKEGINRFFLPRISIEDWPLKKFLQVLETAGIN